MHAHHFITATAMLASRWEKLKVHHDALFSVGLRFVHARAHG